MLSKWRDIGISLSICCIWGRDWDWEEYKMEGFYRSGVCLVGANLVVSACTTLSVALGLTSAMEEKTR